MKACEPTVGHWEPVHLQTNNHQQMAAGNSVWAVCLMTQDRLCWQH